MRELFRNPHFRLFIAVYAACLAALAISGRPLADIVAALVILGIGMPAASLALCWRLPVPGAPAPRAPGEALTLALLLALIAAFLAVKGQILGLLLPSPSGIRLQEAVNTAVKLAVFVAIPAAVLYWRHRAWPAAGARAAPLPRLWLAFIGMAIVGLAVQVLLGAEFKRFIGGDYLDRRWLLASALCFGWMSVEAGLVEEFFFRWLLQSRLAALTGSEVSALFLGALAFGLAHAPGLWLRGAGVAEGLGASPDVLTALAYSVTTQGVAGLAFGVLWSRTRSFVLIVALHGLIDAPASLATFMDTWGW